MEELTDRQEEILDTIKKYIAKNGYPPTVREIGALLNLSSPATTHFHLNRLEKKGYIKKGKSKNRCLEVLVPNEYLTIPTEIIPKKSEVFALNVEGTSMINKGIEDGDIVIIKRLSTANNGDIVAAMTSENEVTLKSFYKEKDHIRLQPENDTMKPIILDNVTILGKAVGLYRKF